MTVLNNEPLLRSHNFNSPVELILNNIFGLEPKAVISVLWASLIDSYNYNLSKAPYLNSLS